jgi:simple sugar transport system ATP-binding protein
MNGDSDNRDRTALIRIERISKRFGSLWANRDISLDILEGEIHAVVGENGAGKSTLMNILYGHLQPNGGRMMVRGKPVRFRHPGEAIRAGIGMVHQQPLIFPQLSALENIIVGTSSRGGPLSRHRNARDRLAGLCALFGFDLPLHEMAGDLSFAHRQQIEILRVLYREAGILILDEPTSLLAPPEVERFLGLLKSLRQAGHTLLFISHRLREVFATADRISVLNRGRLLQTLNASQSTIEETVRLIVHEDPAAGGDPAVSSKEPASKGIAVRKAGGEPYVVLRNVFTGASDGEPGLIDFSLDIREGEIVGIGGVVGNGQRSLALVLAGLIPVDRGSVRISGIEIDSVRREGDSRRILERLPANPMEEALLPGRALWENLLLGRQRDREFQVRGRLDKAEAIRYACRLLDAADVAYSDVNQHVDSLSGGNQQKVALARVLGGSRRFLILEQPGRGLDIRAQQRLYERIRAMNVEGVTFLILSYDLEELLALCHRVGILYRGGLTGMMEANEASREVLGMWMLGIAGSNDRVVPAVEPRL